MYSKVVGEAPTALCFTAKISQPSNGWGFCGSAPEEGRHHQGVSAPLSKDALGIARKGAVPGSILEARGAAAQLQGTLFFKTKLIPGQPRDRLLLQPEISPGTAPGTGHPGPDPAPALQPRHPVAVSSPQATTKRAILGRKNPFYAAAGARLGQPRPRLLSRAGLA